MRAGAASPIPRCLRMPSRNRCASTPPPSASAAACKKDTELHGQTMRAGDFVCLAYGSGNRDERQYPEPGRLRHRPQAARPSGLRRRRPCLPRRFHRRLAARLAFDEFHKAIPEYTPVETQICLGCRPRRSAARWNFNWRGREMTPQHPCENLSALAAKLVVMAGLGPAIQQHGDSVAFCMDGREPGHDSGGNTAAVRYFRAL